RAPPHPSLPEGVQVERNLATIGFFSVAGGIPADGNLERTIDLERRTAEGRVKATATIAALKSTGGFPGVEEQDLYYAILSAVGEALSAGLEIPSPLKFAPGELLRRMGKVPSGSAYENLAKQLRCLAGTTIVSDQAVYRAATSEWVSSREEIFRVIDRVVIRGETAPDGTVAQDHLIWLSSWQIENLRARHAFLVDYTRYRRLKKSIARALLPHLQVWLFASRNEGKCERLYEALCQTLSIKVESQPSNIRKQFKAPLEELIDAGYLRDWSVERAADPLHKRYKIVFHHGPLFTDELLESRLLGVESQVEPPEPPSPREQGDEFVELLVSLGVWRRQAIALARMGGVDRGRALRVIDYVKARHELGEIDNLGAYVTEMLRAEKRGEVEVNELDAGVRGASTRGRARRGVEVGAAGRNAEWEQEVNRNAIAELERMRAEEAETEAILASLSPTEKAALLAAASDELVRVYPKSPGWKPEVRDNQRDVIMRR
ncbi:MAG TPA: replication initiator protein A, partial [Blastocatellia bacterium]|nr:replication initiator protein A [Blastocatellia bacterium]